MRVDFRDVFAATANAYMLLDPQLRFVYANAAYLALTGTRLDELLGRTIFDRFPNDPDDPNDASRTLLRASLERAVRTKQRDHLAVIPYRVARAPGSAPELRLWSATHTPILDARGEVSLILQHTQDVTEIEGTTAGADVLGRAEQLQRAHAQLDAQVASLRAMFDQAPGFIVFVRGKHHVFELANAAYEQLVGGRACVGKPAREVLPELAGQGYFELLDRVYASGEPYVGTASPVTIDRGRGIETRYLDFLFQPIRKPDGTTLGVLVQGHDITEQKRSELRQLFLTRASERLATAWDDIDGALCGVADAAVASFADWAFVDRFADGASRRVACAHARPDDAALAAELRAWPLPPEIPTTHALLGALDGRPRVLPELTPELAASFVRGVAHGPLIAALALRSMLALPLVHRGQTLGVMILATSHSGRRYDDHDLIAMEELARVVAAALDNAHLVREREELIAREQAANRAKDDFLAMLGHELRNPLAPILTAVQLVRLRGDESSTREIAVIERQAQHLVRLVDDLLDVTKIARGKIELRCGPIELATVIAKAVEIVAPQLETKGHQLTVDVPRGLRAWGDETRLSQVVSNLLTNAARYTEPGGHVSLTARREGDALELVVRDDGIGITAEMLPRIFELFVQAPQASSRPHGGLGLGLTLVRRLVELHDGTVTAASDGPGAGSTFTIRLPALGDARSTPPPIGGTRPLASARRVLVVDDDRDASELLADLLRRRGHMVSVAANADAAIAEVTADPPDVAVLDIGLPGRSGYELARAIRALPVGRGVHLIALTGYDSPEDRAAGLAAGFDAHLTKPVDTATLLRMIEAPRLAG